MGMFDKRERTKKAEKALEEELKRLKLEAGAGFLTDPQSWRDMKANLKGLGQAYSSLDAPKEQGAAATIGEVGLGSLPGVGQIMAARDLARSAGEGDGLGMGLSALGLLPFGGVVKNSAAKVVRSKRRVGTTGKYVGAPPDIDSPQKYSALIDKYVGNMHEGLPGREFYRSSSADAYTRAAGNTDLADRFVDNLAILSRSNNVAGNTTMSAKGHVQAMTGDPIFTGRFPARDSPAVAEAYSTGAQYAGHKREPFSEQLAVRWAPERVGRGVNDMHEAEAMGYPPVIKIDPKTGKETRKFVVNTPQQHAFMDEVRAKAIERANTKKIGGFDDWDTGTAQAANWTANKIHRGEVKPGDAAKDYALFLPRMEANATFEAVPGAGTGHLQGVLDAPYESRGMFGKKRDWKTEHGNDVLYAAQGLLPGKTAESVGRFRDEVNPAFVARPITALETLASGGQEISAGSKRALNATEAFRAYMDAQNAGAWHKVTKPGGAGEYAAAGLDFGNLNEGAMKRLAPLLEARNYYVASAPGGMTVLTNEGTKKGSDFASELKDLLKSAKMKPEVFPGRLESGYIPMFEHAGDGPSPITHQLLRQLDASPTTAKALESNPAVAEHVLRRNALDLDAQSAGFGTARQDLLLARQIFAQKGIAGLREAARQGLVPIALLGIVGAGALSTSRDDEY